MKLQRSYLLDFAKDLKTKGKCEHTIRSYSKDAESFLSFLEQNSYKLVHLEPAILLDYQKYLKNDKAGKTNTVRRSVIGIRQFFRFLARQDLIAESPFDSLPIPSREDNLQAIISAEDLNIIVEEAALNPNLFKATRDSAIISLLAFEGLKSSEIININNSDFLYTKKLGSLRVQGSKSRIINLSHESSKRLISYQSQIDQTNLSNRTKLFISFKGKDKLRSNSNISRHGIKFMLYEIGKQSGIPQLNAEHLRSYAVYFLNKIGRNLEEIQAHLGLRRPGDIAKLIEKYEKISA